MFAIVIIFFVLILRFNLRKVFSFTFASTKALLRDVGLQVAMADSVHGGSTQTSGADMQYLQQLCSSGARVSHESISNRKRNENDYTRDHRRRKKVSE